MRSWELGDVFVLRHSGFPFEWLEELGVGAEVVEAAEATLAAEREAERAGESSPGAAEAHADFRRRYRARREGLRARLHERAADPRVREAVFLSTPDMYENVWAAYASRPLRPANAKTRRVERQVYTYLQRLCAKNETASFFGPMGYGVAAEDAIFELVSNPRPARRVFFAFWGVEELARAIARDEELLPWLPARRNPLLTADGAGTLRDRLLAALDEHGSVEGAAASVGVPTAGALEALRPLVRSRAITVGIPLAERSFEAFESLVAGVGALPESNAKRRWLERLRRLEALRARFEAGRLDERRRALRAVEEIFTGCTGAEPRRGAGSLYADRLLLYEEAESPWRIRIGTSLLRSIGAALGPALELSAAYGERVQTEAARCACACVPDGPTSFVAYSERAQTLLPPRLVQPALEIDGADGEVRLPTDLSGTSGAGGRYALPDLCIAAPSARAIAEGRFRLVISTLHHHLLLWSWLAAFFPDRSRFEAAARSWIEEQAASTPLVALDVKRRNKGFYAFPGPRIALSGSAGDRSGPPGLDVERLSVERDGDTPVLVTEDGRRIRLYLPLADLVTYPPLAALSHPLVLRAPIASSGGHVPRALVGDAVYQRERWHARLEGLDRLDEPDLFLEVHERRRSEGWPRFCFVRAAGERKPFFVDFESPFALEALRHVSRGGNEVVIEEMLPAPEELWLRDELGRRYTCELRMQAVRRGAALEGGQ